jgi:hypothetical protein
MKALSRFAALLVLAIAVPTIPQASPVAGSQSAKATDHPEWTEFLASVVLQQSAVSP